MKVKGAIFVGQGSEMPLEDLELTDPGVGEVLVHYGASGLCHSDLSVLNGTLPIPGPSILGHEGAGTVEAVGPGVEKVKPGDTVVVSFIPVCGQCFHCVRGQSQLCEVGFFAPPKFTRSDGAMVGGALGGCATFAECTVIHERSVVKVETDVPVEQLALIGCGVTTGTGAVLNTAKVEPGSTVAVIGCGGVGTAAIQGARIAGASMIVAVDTVQSKLDMAMKLGATHGVLAGGGQDPVTAVKALTQGRGVDYAFEVIGHAATLTQAYNMVRRRGMVVAVGVPAFDALLEVPIGDLIFGEKIIQGSLYGSAQVSWDFPRLVGLVESGQLDLNAMVSSTISLNEVNDGFRAMQAGEVIRSVISY
ncbi:MAG: Zn-dependent alcohol dehydrogenase [Acidimicrobiales bacterium]|nr:Zn-dependent alcohol dehydrogenase [Acidimicrobiales bacterium]